MFSLKNFMVYGFIFKSLILFKFTFVYGVRGCSNFLLLHVSVQFFQHHLLKRLSFSILYSCLLHHRLIDNSYVGLYLRILFCSFDLINLSLFQYHIVLMTLTLQYTSKLGSLIFPAPFFFAKIVLVIQGSFVFPYEL